MHTSTQANILSRAWENAKAEGLAGTLATVEGATIYINHRFNFWRGHAGHLRDNQFSGPGVECWQLLREAFTPGLSRRKR